MSASHPARLAFAAAALGVLGFAPAAQAATVLANVAGTVFGAVVANKLARGKSRSASCRLYDREGREVYLPCDANRPLGDVIQAQNAAPAYAAPSYAPPPAYSAAYSMAGDCGCVSAYGGAGYSQSYGDYGYDGAYGYRDSYGYGQAQYGSPYNGAPVVANVAGRDELGFLTWAGKRGR